VHINSITLPKGIKQTIARNFTHLHDRTATVMTQKKKLQPRQPLPPPRGRSSAGRWCRSRCRAWCRARRCSWCCALWRTGQGRSACEGRRCPGRQGGAKK